MIPHPSHTFPNNQAAFREFTQASEVRAKIGGCFHKPGTEVSKVECGITVELISLEDLKPVENP